MSFKIQRYLPNLFVGVIIEAGICRLLGRVLKNNNIIKTFETIFDNPKEDEVDGKVIKYLQEKSQEYHSTYIAFFLNSIGQGAIEGVSISDFDRHSVDIKNVNYTKVGNSWSVYASYIDVKWAKNMFKPMELDLLYSPFVLLYECIKSRPIEDKPTLYIYNHEGSFAVGVCEKTDLLFGAFFKTSQQDNTVDDIVNVENWEEIEDDGMDNLVELEDIQLDDDGMDDLEELGNLEEYDTLEDLDDLDDLEEDINLEANLEESTKKTEDKHRDAEKSVSMFGRDMNMYNYLISAIREFYSDTVYNHTFLDSIVIFDNHEITETIVNMMENELMMSVRVQKVKTLDLLCDLAVKDIFS